MATGKAYLKPVSEGKGRAQIAQPVAAEIPLYIMLAPAIVLVLVYSYAPMIGIVMAFQRVLPGKGIFGSPWVGLDNFRL
jgi:putative aldouronate transport system permease protein